MASLEFEDYYLDEFSYKKNINYVDSDQIDLNSDISCSIQVKRREETAFVNLKVTLGSLDNTNAAFKAVVDIVGKFNYQKEKNTEYDISFEKFLTENSLAILWSFIRPLFSNLITNGNQYPNYILPVINISKMLKDSGKIEINYD
ncbi:protein-export chaperone SecB [Limosilactobacillus albertensis]|uniref:Protein-export chaperone SecB n=1 Tax=Limosilactobacillus albertensis TaxID=2759752 RepID=A0A839GZ44_9LACO|nr:protein-export chaperone SecB [Limosilactobacillus albertensis]MBB1122704.1 protein-export chaperone SecB [Limosilactobacillus albertensis]MCD7122276.1 protein-export chaperone SecB [Limosilactobacillus albertensis]